MYVGTKFIVRDTSTVAPIINDSTSANKPLYMSMFSSDRGPENLPFSKDQNGQRHICRITHQIL